jgi:hypothetical protein
MFGKILLGLLLGSTLVACSGGGDRSPGNPPSDPAVTGQAVTGSGVKGPLAGAEARVYALDTAASDLKGELLASGATGTDAKLIGLSIPFEQSGLVLLEITANDSTVDLTTGAAPVLRQFRSVLDVTDIQSGNVFATPLTTLAVDLAQARADSNTPPFTGDNDGSISDIEMMTALPLASRLVVSSLGFGLPVTTNVFTAAPLLTDTTDSEDEQRQVLAYRQAIEALAAVVTLIVDDAKVNNPGSELTNDAVVAAIAADLSDGDIDGQGADGPLLVLSDVRDVAAIAATNPANLMIPGTTVPVANVAQVVVAEVAQTGTSISTDAISNGSVEVALRSASVVTDFDGDGVDDRADAFPEDSTETRDTDGDGIGDNADPDADNDGTDDANDAFPFDAAEVADFDGDGIGNNADPDDDNDGVADIDDRFPNDANEFADADGDGLGNNTDPDDDNDGVRDELDAFPTDGAETADIDGDGVGNNADTDDDNDGVLDTDDQLPLDNRGAIASVAVVGASGGTVTSTDQRLTIEIPEGALGADTEFTIGQLNADTLTSLVGEGGSEQPYLLLPTDQQFEKPVTATFTFAEGDERSNRTKIPFFVSDNLVDTLDDAFYKPLTKKSTVPLMSLGTFSFGFGRVELLGQDLVDAVVGESFTAQYEFKNVGSSDIAMGEIEPEGFDGTTFSVQPTLTNDDGFVTNLAHASAPALPLTAGSSSNGSITGNCVDVGRSTITFNVDYRDIIDSAVLFNTRPAKGQQAVEIDVSCTDAIQPITTALVIPVGPGIDRVSAIPFNFQPAVQNRTLPPQRLIVVSDNQTLVTSFDGSNQTSISTQPEPDNFGALIVKNDSTERVFTYGAGGMTGGLVEDGSFVRLFGGFFNKPPATDLIYALDENGNTDPTRAISVEGDILYEYFVDGDSPERREVMDVGLAVSGYPRNSVSFAPISKSQGVIVTRGADSEAWLLDLQNKTGSKIADVGQNALNVRCVAGLAGGVVGCAVSAFDSKEVNTLFGRGSDFVSGPVIAGASTATVGVGANSVGDLIVSFANDTSNALTLAQFTPPSTQTDTGSPFPFEPGLKVEYLFSDFFSINAEVGFVFSLIGRSEEASFIAGSPQLPNGGAVVSGKDGNGDGFVGVIPGELFGAEGTTVWFK